MKKNHLILATILLPLLLIAIFTAWNFSNKPAQYPEIIKNQNNNENLITFAPSKSRNIEVLSPRTGDTVKSGFRVLGNARVFENVVSIRVLDSLGNILNETSALANAPDVGQFGSFEKILNFQTNDSSGTVEVFQYSAKDGSEVDKVTIPVLFD